MWGVAGVKNRIAAWAGAGCLVASFWVVFFLFYPRTWPVGRITWTLAAVSQPVALVGHFGLRWYTVVLANAATYAMLGLLLELLRRQPAAAK